MISRKAIKKVLDAGCTLTVHKDKEGKIKLTVAKTVLLRTEESTGVITEEALELTRDKVISIFVEDMVDGLMARLLR